MASAAAASFALEPAGLARLSHVSIEVADLDRALAFYRDVFGMQIVFEMRLEGPEFERVSGSPGARSRLVRGLVANGTIVQLFWHDWREPDPSPRTLMSFEVRDVREAHRALAARGVSCQSEPVDFESSSAFVLHDPDGHPIELIQWAPEASPYRASHASRARQSAGAARNEETS